MADYARERFKDVLGNHAQERLGNIIKGVAGNLQAGHLPLNHTLEKAAYESLGRATQALAWHLHDPNRQPMSGLLKNFSDWPEFFTRGCELVQGNIVAGDARAHWLRLLIERSKEPENYADFKINPVLDEAQVTRLLHGQADPEFSTHIHQEFLAWVKRHVPDKGHKPKDFSNLVMNGWPVLGGDGSKLTFYDVFCIFFREALKQNDEAFRAFSLKIYTSLQGDINAIKTSLPSGVTMEQFTNALERFNQSNIDAALADFRNHLDRQNQEVLGLLREVAADVKQTLQNTVSIQDELAKILDSQRVANELIQAMQKRLQQAQPKDSTESPVDFESALNELAKRYGVSPEQIQAKVEKWIEETKKTSRDLVELAKAAFLEQQFDKAAKLYHDSAEGKLLRADARLQKQFELMKETLELIESAVSDLIDSGNAYRAGQKPCEALACFELANSRIDRSLNPELWAELQMFLALAHAEIGETTEGIEIKSHLQKAVAANRAALEIYTRINAPQDWAMIQNNLGSVLSFQAARTRGQEAVALLAQAITAYRTALEVITRNEHPQLWIAIQNNLAIAFRDQAIHTSGPATLVLLTQAVTTVRATLEGTACAQSPQLWAMIQNNLGNTLRHQAAHTTGSDALKLLVQAVIAYRAALEAITRNKLPRLWAITQNNLAIVLRHQADLSTEPESVALLIQAVVAFRAALEVTTRAHSPQLWAIYQNNLGNALCSQATRLDGPETIKLSAQAITAYRAALEVRMRTELPQDWAMTQNNLGNALLNQASHSEGQEAINLLTQAIDAFQAALEIRTHTEMPQKWAMTQHNLGYALLNQASHSEGQEVINLLTQAIDAFQAALKIRTKAEFPSQYEKTNSCLQLARSNLKQMKKSAGNKFS